jgi:hypothetical protein
VFQVAELIHTLRALPIDGLSQYVSRPVVLHSHSVAIDAAVRNSSFTVQANQNAFVIDGESAVTLNFADCAFMSADMASAIAFACLSSSNSSTPLDRIEFSNTDPSTFQNVSITLSSMDAPACTNVDCGDGNR